MLMARFICKDSKVSKFLLAWFEHVVLEMQFV